MPGISILQQPDGAAKLNIESLNHRIIKSVGPLRSWVQ